MTDSSDPLHAPRGDSLPPPPPPPPAGVRGLDGLDVVDVRDEAGDADEPVLALFGDPAAAEPVPARAAAPARAARPTAAAPDRPRATARAAERPAAADAPSGIERPTSGPPALSPRLIMIGVVAVLVVGFGAFLLLRTPSDSTTATVATGDVVKASFGAGTASALGSTDSGGAWQAVTGTWGVEAGQAKLASPDGVHPRNVAVVDIGRGDGYVAAKAASVQPGWGLVFRFQDKDNYSVLVAAPDFASYAFSKVAAGKVTAMGKPIGPLANVDGTIVRVDFQGPVITLSINGKPQLTVNDPSFQPATKVGMLVDTSASNAKAKLSQFDDFEAQANATGATISTAPVRAAGGPTSAAQGPDATNEVPANPTTTKVKAAAPTTAADTSPG